MDKTKSRQTPGQARSRAGKIARKAEKKRRLAQEASSLGITVAELLRRKSLEADEAKQRNAAAIATLGRGNDTFRRSSFRSYF